MRDLQRGIAEASVQDAPSERLSGERPLSYERAGKNSHAPAPPLRRPRRRLLRLPAQAAAASPATPERCEVDLETLGVFSNVGQGARARAIEDAAELIGGEMAHGQVGDYLLENEQIRVVVQRPSRVLVRPG